MNIGQFLTSMHDCCNFMYLLPYWCISLENKRFIVIYSHIGFISWILSLIYQFRFSVCFYSKMTLSTVKLNITLFPSWNKHSFLLNSRELHKLWTSMHDTSWFHEIKINSDIFRYFRLYVWWSVVHFYKPLDFKRL